MLMGCGSHSPIELALNGGLEQTRPDGTLVGWWIGALPTSAHVPIPVSTTDAYGDAVEGMGFVTVATSAFAALDSPMARSDELPCPCAGRVFQLDASSRGLGGEVTLRWLDSSGGASERNWLHFEPSAHWTTESVAVTAPPWAAGIQVLLIQQIIRNRYPPWAVTDPVDFDAVSLRTVD